MYFNRIITMPITETTRCRVYKSSTSFMAKTFFHENGTPRNVEIVDTIQYEISNTLTVTSHLMHNESSDVYIIKYFNIDNNCLYYLIFNICDLHEVLSMIYAKSVLYNKIFEIKECEYFDCQLDNGLFIFDQYESPFREDAQSKLSRFDDNCSTITSYKTDGETGLIDNVQLDIRMSDYYVKAGNFIFHKSVENKISINDFLKVKQLKEFNITCPSKVINLMSSLSTLIESDSCEYLLNKQGSRICIKYKAGSDIGFIVGNIITRIKSNTNINSLKVTPNPKSIIIDKSMFTIPAYEKAIQEIDEMFRIATHSDDCTEKLEEILKRLELDDIFVLFNM